MYTYSLLNDTLHNLTLPTKVGKVKQFQAIAPQITILTKA